MAYLHQGLTKTMYGRLLTDEEFTVRLHHVMRLKEQGFPVQWFRDKFNRVKIMRNGVWWVMDDLAEQQPLFDWRK